MTVVQRIEPNASGRDFVVGDIHGWLGPLQSELDAVCFDTRRDRLFSVGDLINRGPDSAACLELLREPWFFAVRGNHEQILFDWLSDSDSISVDDWMRYGGRAWLGEGPEHFFARHADLRCWCERLSRELPWVIELELPDGRLLLISHSTLPQGDWPDLRERLPKEMSLRDEILWQRPVRVPGFERWIGGVDLCVHGHVVVPGVGRCGNGVYVDTGAALFDVRYRSRGKTARPRITAIEVGELFHVPPLSRQVDA
ncbi:metallophosphoesterase [Marinobacterium weihaiense]|uniref:Metallophosphoesterase n=1 Tax=Marinobacterium weihaiense TaxID=2851016 RepID=A0ABS6M7B3_9GAMM|nr:metallophosphoesterase [Marinobacterium weihaiense]MBV0932070.1 metallophosphoesterase [Marinobacterium weihaiense]